MQHRLFAIAFLILASCTRDTAGPDSPSTPLRGMAVALTVDLAAGTVRQAMTTPMARAVGPNFALLGQHEIAATATHFTRSAVGTYMPLRVRVKFDLALTNRMANSNLVPSTFPTPPAQEVVAFAFSTDPAGLFGLRVRSSTDWDGGMWNFFNDGICIALTPPSDCFRWEGFGATIPAGATTPARSVGFDVDPTVQSFTVYVVVAADVQDRPGAASGAVAGLVRSESGPLSGVTVSITGTTLTATTSTTGLYAIGGVPPGPHHVSLGALPGTCLNPGPQEVTVAAGGVAVADFSVACPPAPGGSITGSITANGTPLTGTVLVIVTPTGRSPISSSAVLISGIYRVFVPVAELGDGTGTVEVVPGGECAAPPVAYSGLVGGTEVRADLVVYCVGLPPLPEPEVCDGRDNDLDGLIDEGFTLPCAIVQPPTVSSLLPELLTIPAGSYGTLTVTISPLQPAATVVQLTANPPSTVSVPESITIPAGQASASLNVTGLIPGTATVTATVNSSTVSSTVTVQ